MKNILVAFMLCMFAGTVFAQKVVEKTISANGKKEMFLDAKFATDIELATWDKNEIYVKASASIDEGEFDDYFDLVFSDDGSSLDIEEEYGTLWDDLKEKWKKKKNDKKYCCNTDMEITYKVFVPNGLRLRLKSISGSAVVSQYKGDLTVEFISGDVEIKRYDGNVSLKTISGDLDIKVDEAFLVAETFSGTIYSDESLSFQADKRRSFGQRIKGTIKSDRKTIKLDSHSGNIFIRKF